ncbi:hypothetical protein GCM10023196_079020 [Actinoallomurus vinaceus]|uniref:Lipoprotein n=1 Tax=Actinoallomurus vinaceus TaxID=1080074 RepID=A0ABP8UPE6_9ACTN
MRKLAATVAAALAVVGAGASTASAATTGAKPKTHGTWNLNSQTKGEKGKSHPVLKYVHTWGSWTLGTKPHKKGKWLTINGKLADVSPGDTGVAYVIVRIKLSGKLVQKPAKYSADTPQARPFTVTYTAKNASQVGKVTVTVQKLLYTTGDNGTNKVLSKEFTIK